MHYFIIKDNKGIATLLFTKDAFELNYDRKLYDLDKDLGCILLKEGDDYDAFFMRNYKKGNFHDIVEIEKIEIKGN